MSDNGHKPNGSANKKTGKTIKVGKKKIRIRKAIKKPAAPSREASLSAASGSSSASNMQKKKRQSGKDLTAVIYHSAALII